ncbi:MAG: hypothetical protein KC486_10200 [Myxococcales bacterium]|nr:hypothetical protein [Myxococcales bacterium]
MSSTPTAVAGPPVRPQEREAAAPLDPGASSGPKDTKDAKAESDVQLDFGGLQDELAADAQGEAPPVPEIEDLNAPGSGSAPPMPEIEDLNETRAKAGGSGGAPPPAGVEDIGGGGGGGSGSAKKGAVIFGGDKDREPIGGGGAGFFDPGRLSDEGPAGGALQIRGYLGVNFMVTERTNRSARDPETGKFQQLSTLPYFGGGAANIYVGAPIYSDVVYARVAFEFLSVPRADVGAADVAPVWAPVVLMESAALEINPFAWADKSGRWLREGFKITAGVFIVPFGLEDEEHDAPVRWFVTRPLAMSAGRVYPGSWIDVGAMIKWKPTFGRDKPIRPLEIDVGVINGDACTQTRSTDLLYRFQPIGQVDEVCERRLRDVEMVQRADGSVLGITPDNNGNKSVVGRLQLRPIPAMNIGGSMVWGKHPQSTFTVTNFQGMTYADSLQAPTWRAGGHFDLNLDEALQSKYPLPHIRAEVIYGIDRAARVDDPVLGDRHMLGGYVQIAQPLWRRKKTRLPGLILQYRFDHADPDLAVPRLTGSGGAVNSDFSDAYLYDEAFQAHVVGLRFPVLPRFTLKTEYGVLLEDGGPKNQLYNNFWTLQAVADF